MNFPSEFATRMSGLLPDYQEFLASYADTPLVGLRANGLKISADELKKLLPHIKEPVSWCKDGFYYGTDFRPGKSPYYHAGLYYIQEPSAMSSAAVMDVSPGQRVLDLCAAPGGKSTQIAAKLAGSGLLVSNDVSATRARALLKNIELSGAVNIVITNEPPARLAARFSGYFDRILVDAPCSGEGMFRRDPDALKAWTKRKPEACSVLQREILHFAAMMLKPGGRLMYSTCTFAPEENELMIEEFLSTHEGFAGVAIAHTEFGLEPGLRGEVHTARIWPHRQKGEGHFMAYLEKQAEDGAKQRDGSHASYEARKMLPRFTAARSDALRDGLRKQDEYTEFCDKYLNFTPEPNSRHGNSLHISPPELPDLSGLRVLRTGLYLGDVLTKRFEPSQAFAMSLDPDKVKACINFSIDDSDLFRYLKGESFVPGTLGTVPANLSDGWSLITLDTGKKSAFPIGWAKVTDGRIKNKYPKGWLMT